MFAFTPDFSPETPWRTHAPCGGSWPSEMCPCLAWARGGVSCTAAATFPLDSVAVETGRGLPYFLSCFVQNRESIDFHVAAGTCDHDLFAFPHTEHEG